MIVVLIAAYNEEEGLADILPRIPDRISGHRTEVLVVDDGSDDATCAVARSQGCTVIRATENRGKGATLKLGLEYAIDLPFAALALMDGDGQHTPEDLQALCQPVLEHRADMVVGSRYSVDTGRGTTPWNRYLVRTITSLLLNAMLPVDVTDPFSGYRCFSHTAARRLKLVGNRYESELEMLFCAARQNCTVVEVPIERLYGKNTSKMGARLGPLLGRVDVVSGYARTIARESFGLVASGRTKSRARAA